MTKDLHCMGSYHKCPTYSLLMNDEELGKLASVTATLANDPISFESNQLISLKFELIQLMIQAAS